MLILCEIFRIIIAQWSEDCRKCVQSHRWNFPLEYQPCVDQAEDQNLEVGRWLELSNGTNTLQPVLPAAWQHRQAAMRKTILGRRDPPRHPTVEHYY